MIKIKEKIITTAVILLFLGPAFAPSINANVGKKELVEFTTEVCGLNGGKQTVKLTQQQADEVEALFDSIREQLNATESREEAEEIFKDAVVELNNYGLLGGLSVKQAQRLVLGLDALKRNNKLLDYFSNIPSEENKNIFCLMLGNNKNCVILNPYNFVFVFFLVFLFARNNALWSFLMEYAHNLWEFLTDNFAYLFLFLFTSRLAGWFVLGLISLLFPLSLFGFIHFGFIQGREYIGWDHIPSEGLLQTFGLYGKKTWEGKYYGNSIGFTGLKIKYFIASHFYLGHSVYLEINED